MIARLGLRDLLVVVRGYDRPNLFLSVERAAGTADKRARVLDAVRRVDGLTIVWAATKKHTEAPAQVLGVEEDVLTVLVDDVGYKQLDRTLVAEAQLLEVTSPPP